FWIPKIERNMQRDRENNRILTAMGFTVLRFWDKEVIRNLESCIQAIHKSIDAEKPTSPAISEIIPIIEK
ncbi:MAG TPA: DUF559 domain-containing protein, partial [Sphingobacteriaceae bacterium]